MYLHHLDTANNAFLMDLTLRQHSVLFARVYTSLNFCLTLNSLCCTKLSVLPPLLRHSCSRNPLILLIVALSLSRIHSIRCRCHSRLHRCQLPFLLKEGYRDKDRMLCLVSATSGLFSPVERSYCLLMLWCLHPIDRL